MLKKLFLRTIGRIIPSDVFAPRFPVSVKGVCLIDGRVVVVQNERGEWDLPGGKLQKGEGLKRALAREIREELGIEVHVGRLLQAMQLPIMNQIEVLVIIFECFTEASFEELKISGENFAWGTYSVSELGAVNFPFAYKEVVKSVSEQGK
ncbi:MAG: NUDIX domain-containing protein [Bacteroidota bacterium]